jgi:hypothetical protein
MPPHLALHYPARPPPSPPLPSPPALFSYLLNLICPQARLDLHGTVHIDTAQVTA